MENQLNGILEGLIRPIVVNAVMDCLEGLGLNKMQVTPEQDRYEQGVNVACEELGTKSQTIYQNIDRIPHRKLHGKLYFNRAELQRYINLQGSKK